MQHSLLLSPACRRDTTLGPLPISALASSRIGVSKFLGSITAPERAPQGRRLMGVVNFLRLSHTRRVILFRVSMSQQIVDVRVVLDPNHFATLPPDLDRRVRTPIRTDLLPQHDQGLAVHPPKRQLPLPGQRSVADKVAGVLQLADERIHDLELCVDLNQMPWGFPVS